ncbi:MAG: hypothetical protein ABIT76_13180 [Chthoniobacterales bacterium]
MSTEISTSQDFIKDRVEKTRAAQATLANEASWTWPLKSLADWDADLLALDATKSDTLAGIVKGLDAAMLSARGLLDARFDALHKFTLLTVGVMRVRAATMPGLIEIVNDLSSRGDSRRTVEDEADDLLAAWEEWEEQTAAPFLPAPGKGLPEFKLLLDGAAGAGQTTTPMLATLKKTYKAALTKWRRSAGVLNVLFARLEDECIAWYAEATKVFPEGTPEGDMIRSQVPTDYTPTPPTPPVQPTP